MALAGLMTAVVSANASTLPREYSYPQPSIVDLSEIKEVQYFISYAAIPSPHSFIISHKI